LIRPQRPDILFDELRQNNQPGVHMTVRFAHTASMLATVLMVAAGPLHATGYMTVYSGDTPLSVYKSVDSSGKVTYSSARPRSAIAFEKIRLEPGPSAEYIDQTRQRHEKIMATASELAATREQREAEREEEEIKRLERLALQRSIRPKVYERRVYVGWSPFWRPYPPVHHDRKYPYPLSQPSHPLRNPGLSYGISLSTGPAPR
jgi:hypothetical protein